MANSINKPRGLRIRAVIGAALTLVSVCASAGVDDARQWLDRMSTAMQSLNYQGTFVYLHGGEIETMRIVHSRDESGERERLLSLNGEAREVIRDDNSVTCIWPGTRAVTVSKARPRTPFPATIPGPERLEAHYRIVTQGEARIAGMLARVIAIQPRDEFRYGYRIWLDRETDLLLRSDLLDDAGLPVEQVMFTELQVLDHIPAERFEPILTGTGYTWTTEDENSAMIPDPMWKVQSLPPGYSMTKRDKKPMMPDDNGVEHMVYTDGLATVSVFIEPLGDGQERLEGASRMGAVNVFGAVDRDYQITVVGEVPAATVQYIAQAVVYNP
ncbi:MAG: MucB/RseB C-terminal domain-containing protein [Gammaproteobacteria bacterium]|nr:MucB/RseB C-terminal domain-containing protein [Gammaproteobacteria bacterium]